MIKTVDDNQEQALSQLSTLVVDFFIDIFQKNTRDFSRGMNFDPYLDFVALKL